MDPEVLRDLLERDTGLAIPRDADHISAELFRVRLRHSNILPDPPRRGKSDQMSPNRAAVPTIYNTRELETQQATLGERLEETITLMNQLITTAASTVHDPDDYDRRYHELENRHNQLKAEHQRITDQIDDLRHRRAQAIKVRDNLAAQPPLEYSDQAWNTLIDYATVTADGKIDLHFEA